MDTLGKELLSIDAASMSHFELADFFENNMQMRDTDKFGVYLELAVWNKALNESDIDNHHFNQGLNWVMDSCSAQRENDWSNLVNYLIGSFVLNVGNDILEKLDVANRLSDRTGYVIADMLDNSSE